jgi:predicted nicotinamide N-methyase
MYCSRSHCSISVCSPLLFPLFLAWTLNYCLLLIQFIFIEYDRCVINGDCSIHSVLGSDVIYNEEAVDDLLATLNQLSGKHTTILLAGELRNGKASLSRSLFSFGMGSSD